MRDNMHSRPLRKHLKDDAAIRFCEFEDWDQYCADMAFPDTRAGSLELLAASLKYVTGVTLYSTE